MLLNSCASIAPPQGGEKDVLKPRLQKTNPKNGTVNFKGTTVKYYFSEWVAEDKLREQIIITPEIENFEITVAKNILTLKFDTGSFKPNTTYNLNLRDGIKDLNEGIRSDSTSLVFSTGKYLDSLTLNGEVFFGEDNKKSINIIVSLFIATDTFNIEEQRPIYSTKTDSSSRFVIQNIKPGKYYLYTYKDENNNSKYDKNKEAIGYLKDEINLTSSISVYYINIFNEDFEKPTITYRENKKKSLAKIEYNKDITDLSLRLLSGTKKILPHLKDKTVTLYTDQPSSDSVKVIFTSTDRLNNVGIDTLPLLLNYIDTTRCMIQTIPSTGSEIESGDSVEIFLSKPYNNFEQRIKIKNGREELSNNELTAKYLINRHPLKNSISIISKNGWQDSIRITVYPQSFIPINGYVKDTTKISYTKKDPEKFGTIGGRITTSKENLLIQLLTSDKKVIKQIANKREFLFGYLPDGEYRIRVIIDENKNQKWDQGDYRSRKAPEAIYHYPEAIKLKSNWEILDLNISF